MAQFLSYMIFGFAVCSLLLGITTFRRNPSKEKNKEFLAFCISSSIWSLGFGFLIVQTDTITAWFCRSIGMIGVFPYIIFGLRILMELGEVSPQYKKLVNIISLFGIIIYPFIIQPERQIYELTDFGMAYSFVSDFWTTTYNVYIGLMFILISIILIKMFQSSKLQRKKRLTISLIFFLVVFIFGTILDTVMPLLGFVSFPGSTITQFIGVAIVYATLSYEVKTSASKENIANYIYHSIDFPILAFNHEKKLVFMSDSAYDFFELPKKNNNIKIEDLFSSNEPILKNTKSSWKREYYCKKNNKYCQLAIEKVIDKYKDIVGYIVVIYDLTEQNDIISKLETAKIEAENATKAKENFLANMSHEIRTPLNVVLGMNEMISTENDLNKIYSYSNSIEEAGKSLLTTINDILDFSKIQSGKLNIVNSNYYFDSMLRSSIELLEKKALEKNITMEYKIDSTIPKELCGDEMRMKQILINLINNAIKYTDKGKITIKATKEILSKNEINIIISVEDTGIGIKQKDIKNLFISFKRLEEKTNRMIEGTGLGLSIVQKLIELMDGEILVDSKFGVGSVFTIIIPHKVINKEPIGEFTLLEEKQNIKKSTDKKLIASKAKILAVDDNITNLTVVKGLLKRTKIQVDTATSGIECLEKLKTTNYDTIFLDHMMPEMDGIETLQKILEKERFSITKTPVIALTANAMEGSKEEYLKHGFTDYLSKPISGKDLEYMLNKYLPKDLIENSLEKELKSIKKESSLYDENFLRKNGIELDKALELLGDMTMYNLTIKDFVSEIDDKWSNIKEYRSKKDLKNYAIAVHSLKSDSKYLGLLTLADIAYQHELKSKANDQAYIDKNFKNLENEFNKIIPIIKEYTSNINQ